MDETRAMPRFVGVYLVIIVTAFVGWATLFEIDETIRAQGELVLDGRTQIVQVSEGGVLQELFVREGDRVEYGQRLAKLEPMSAQVAVDETLTNIAILDIALRRARAESQMQTPQFGTLNDRFPSAVKAQIALYDQNLFSLNEQISSIERTLEIARIEYQTLNDLNASGDVSQSEVARAKRNVIDIEAKIQETKNRYITRALEEIVDIERERASLEFKLEDRRIRLARTEVTAPKDGIVTFMSVNTLGGYVGQGDSLLHISPTGESRLVEARISPVDIGNVELGLPVTVRFDAFDSTIYGTLSGKIVYVSADTLTEQAQNGGSDTNYIARIAMDAQQQNPRLAHAGLRPGMTATLDIKTGRRNILTFLAKPVLRSFEGALTQR